MEERSIADDIIDRACCALCTSYLVTKVKGQITGPYEHCYPVACKDCWDEDCAYDKAIADIE